MRHLHQRQDAERRLNFELLFPEKVTIDQVADYLNGIRGMLSGGRWSGSPAIVLELISTEAGPEYRLRAPAELAYDVRNQLQSHIPGIHIEEIDQPTQPNWSVAREFGTSSGRRQLDISSAAAIARTLRAAGRNLGSREMTNIQIVFTAARAPRHVPAPTSTMQLIKPQIKLFSPDYFRPPKELVDEHRAKLEEPNFSVVVRVAAMASNTARAAALVGAIQRALGSASGKAWFKEVGGMSDARPKVHTGAIPWRYPATLMLSELAAITAFPIGTVDDPGLKRPPTKHMRADASIPTKGVVLAHSTAAPDRALAMSPIDLMRHLYIPGTTGQGKTTVLENIALQWVQQPGKLGLTFFDPHGDAAERFLNAIPKARMKDVIYADPLDIECPVGFNPMSGANPTLVTSFMTGVIREMFGAGIATGDYLRNAIDTIALQGNMTLHEVALILEDPLFRDDITRGLTDENLRRFWTSYDNMSKGEQATNVEPVMRRLRPFLTRELRGIFGQSGGVDMQSVVDDGKILVVNLSKGAMGDEMAYMVGAMIAAAEWRAILNRARIPEEQRRPHLLLADEFQNLVKFPTGWGDLTNEARKYRLGLVLANQLMDDIKEIRTHILANTNKLILRPTASDAALLAREIGVNEDDIKRLGKHQAILSLTNDGVLARPATGITLAPVKPVGLADEIKALSRAQYGTPREDVEGQIMARRKLKPANRRVRPTIGREV